MSTKKQIERLKTLYSVIDGIPSQFIDMNDWRQKEDDDGFVTTYVSDDNLLKHNCGTAACAAGFACAYPKFKKQGLKYKEEGYPTYKGSNGFNAMRSFFGVEWIFYPLGNSVNHKKKFLDRLRHYLVEKKAITQKRSNELAAKETT